MAVRFLIDTPEDLIELFEGKAQEARSQMGKTRTKVETNELKGQVFAFNEAIYYVKEYIKTQKESEEDKANGLPRLSDSMKKNEQPAE